jgi:hypothetical protein
LEEIMRSGMSGVAIRRFILGPVLCALLAGAGPLLAQPGPKNATAANAKPAPVMPMDDAARMLDSDPALKNLSQNQRMDVLAFVAGNLVFVLQHEMGHAQVSERALPVLGARDEDAADVFATLSMLNMRSVMSERVLEQAAMGWFLSAKRDESAGNMLTFYEEHALDKQRAYQIVCLMVGADPEKFKRLADESKLPKHRRETCGGDYRNSSYAWEELLKPHRRAPDAPKTKIDVVYGEATGKLGVYAQSAQSMRLLENLAAAAADEFTWKAPLTLEMRSCGQSGARWSPFQRKIILCYEMAADLADVYRKYGKGMKPMAQKPARRS